MLREACLRVTDLQQGAGLRVFSERLRGLGEARARAVRQLRVRRLLQVSLTSMGQQGRNLTSWIGSLMEHLASFSPSAYAFISSSGLKPRDGGQPSSPYHVT